MPFSFKKFFGLEEKKSPNKESPKKEAAPSASKKRENLRNSRKAATAAREAASATRRAEREAVTATRRAKRKEVSSARQSERDEWNQRVKEEIEPLIAEVVKHNSEIKVVNFIKKYKIMHNKKPDIETIKEQFNHFKELEILNINATVMVPSIMNRRPIEDMEMEIMNMKIDVNEEPNTTVFLLKGGRRK